MTSPASVEPQTDNTIANRCWEHQVAPDAKDERLLACFTTADHGIAMSELLLVEKALAKKQIRVSTSDEAIPSEWRMAPTSVMVEAVIVTGSLYDVNGLHIVPTPDGPRIRDVSFSFTTTD